MRVLDLFSGIGGFSLGLERAGMKTIAFCEIDPFCRRVLAKHWPYVPIIPDIITAEFPNADVITGGFPCQDISFAGAGAGLSGSRSGLYRELVRAIRVVRPLYAIMENVAALLSRGMGAVLGDLASIGYDAEWHCIPASAVGAEHERDRVWIVANPDGERELQQEGCEQTQRRRLGDCASEDDADIGSAGLSRRQQTRTYSRDVAPIGSWLRSSLNSQNGFPRDYWNHQPVLGRGIHGVSDRVERVRALGNAVVPQIPEMIGRAILERVR